MNLFNKEFLFICGCPRSGTTALWNLVSSDKRVIIGVERYGNKFMEPDGISEELFERDRFFSLQKGDTHYDNLAQFNEYYTRCSEWFDDAIYVGDKIPLLFHHMTPINKKIPNVKFIAIFRNIFDVAASYKKRFLNEKDNWSHDVGKAIVDWNASINAVKYFPDKKKLHIVDYENLFTSGDGFDALYDFLNLAPNNVTSLKLNNLKLRALELENQRPRDLTQEEVKEICLKADFQGYKNLFSNVDNM